MAASTNLTPEQRIQRARLAALARWSKQDSTEGTKPARDAFLARFETEVDPQGLLPERERRRRAQTRLREHMARLAYRSSRARGAATE